MKYLSKLYAFLFLIISTSSFSSQERAERFEDLRIKTPTAKVEASYLGNSLSKFTIDAFGKRYVLSQEQLDALGSFVNGIQISSEAGYPEIGGETIYIKVFMGFTSSEVKQLFILISEENGVSVRETI